VADLDDDDAPPDPRKKRDSPAAGALSKHQRASMVLSQKVRYYCSCYYYMYHRGLLVDWAAADHTPRLAWALRMHRPLVAHGRMTRCCPPTDHLALIPPTFPRSLHQPLDMVPATSRRYSQASFLQQHERDPFTSVGRAEYAHWKVSDE
jgi:hypothetical protein